MQPSNQPPGGYSSQPMAPTTATAAGSAAGPGFPGMAISAAPMMHTHYATGAAGSLPPPPQPPQPPPPPGSMPFATSFPMSQPMMPPPQPQQPYGHMAAAYPGSASSAVSMQSPAVQQMLAMVPENVRAGMTHQQIQMFVQHHQALQAQQLMQAQAQAQAQLQQAHMQAQAQAQAQMQQAHAQAQAQAQMQQAHMQQAQAQAQAQSDQSGGQAAAAGGGQPGQGGPPFALTAANLQQMMSIFPQLQNINPATLSPAQIQHVVSQYQQRMQAYHNAQRLSAATAFQQPQSSQGGTPPTEGGGSAAMYPPQSQPQRQPSRGPSMTPGMTPGPTGTPAPANGAPMPQMPQQQQPPSTMGPPAGAGAMPQPQAGGGANVVLLPTTSEENMRYNLGIAYERVRAMIAVGHMEEGRGTEMLQQFASSQQLKLNQYRAQLAASAASPQGMPNGQFQQHDASSQRAPSVPLPATVSGPAQHPQQPQWGQAASIPSSTPAPATSVPASPAASTVKSPDGMKSPPPPSSRPKRSASHLVGSPEPISTGDPEAASAAPPSKRPRKSSVVSPTAAAAGDSTTAGTAAPKKKRRAKKIKVEPGSPSAQAGPGDADLMSPTSSVASAATHDGGVQSPREPSVRVLSHVAADALDAGSTSSPSTTAAAAPTAPMSPPAVVAIEPKREPATSPVPAPTDQTAERPSSSPPPPLSPRDATQPEPAAPPPPPPPPPQYLFDKLPSSFFTCLPQQVFRNYMTRERDHAQTSDTAKARFLPIFSAKRTEILDHSAAEKEQRELHGSRFGPLARPLQPFASVTGVTHGAHALKSVTAGLGQSPTTNRKAGVQFVRPTDRFAVPSHQFPMRGYDFGAESHALASVRSAHDEELVAIRIDMEYNGTKFKDVFTWNVAETLLTPHKFAHTLVGDLELPSAMIIPISEAIDKQVAEHIRWRSQTIVAAGPTGPNSLSATSEPRRGTAAIAATTSVMARRAVLAAVPDAATIFAGFGSSSGALDANHDVPPGETESAMETERHVTFAGDSDAFSTLLPPRGLLEVSSGGGWCAPRMEDLRFIIKLHIVVQQTMLVDEFEWDLLCPFNSPERFAARYCLELGLESEFCTLIAHSIREQIQLHLRALVNVRYQFDGTPVAKKSGDLSSHFLLPLEGPLQAYRGTAFHELFTPEFFQIAVQDKAHAEKDDDREARRKRRTGRKERTTGRGGAGSSVITAGSEETNRGGLSDLESLRSARSHMPRPLPLARIQLPKPAATALALAAYDKAHPRGAPKGGRNNDDDTAWVHVGKMEPVMDEKTAAPATLSVVRIAPSESTEALAARRGLLGPSGAEYPNWTCANCQCGPDGTPLRRRGPGGSSLCNACGVYFLATGMLRPLPPLVARYRPQAAASMRAWANKLGGNGAGSAPEQQNDLARLFSQGHHVLPPLPLASAGGLLGFPIASSVAPAPSSAALINMGLPSAHTASAEALQASKRAAVTRATHGRVPADAQEWIHQRYIELAGRFPDSRFQVVKEGPKSQFRLVCEDCGTKSYAIGPGLSFSNFESHLKVPSHVKRVRQRSAREAAAAAWGSDAAANMPALPDMGDDDDDDDQMDDDVAWSRPVGTTGARPPSAAHAAAATTAAASSSPSSAAAATTVVVKAAPLMVHMPAVVQRSSSSSSGLSGSAVGGGKPPRPVRRSSASGSHRMVINDDEDDDVDEDDEEEEEDDDGLGGDGGGGGYRHPYPQYMESAFHDHGGADHDAGEEALDDAADTSSQLSSVAGSHVMSPTPAPQPYDPALAPMSPLRGSPMVQQQHQQLQRESAIEQAMSSDHSQDDSADG